MWAIESAAGLGRLLADRHHDLTGLRTQAVCRLHGVGPVIAAMILGQVGDIDRFRTRAQFANYNGTAPIEASSANTNPHRLNPRGNRALNHAIHKTAVTQVGHDTPGHLTMDAVGSRAVVNRVRRLIRPELPDGECLGVRP